MSFKKSKLDLLVRVRYSNPLPAPPCPPKLLQIPTNPSRYADPAFLNALAGDTPLPMIVDAECGMPLDLGRWECLWEEGGDDAALNPDPTHLPPLDPRDKFLLSDPTSSGGPGSGAGGIFTNGGAPTAPLPAHVPWLRKTEYISREGVQRGGGQEPKLLPQAHIDVSRTAQLATIESSFASNQPLPSVSIPQPNPPTPQFDLSSLTHPSKPHLHAIDSYEIFPDATTWANAYDLFRFSERPGERGDGAGGEDPRLECAVLRPMESDGDHFLAYYLTEGDADAVRYKASRAAESATQAKPATDDPLAFLNDDDDDLEKKEGEGSTAFHFVRDYETVKVEQEVPNEFLLVLDDDQERGKGAYYKNIERKMILKKKRTNTQEAYLDKWERVNLTHTRMSAEEAEEREEVMAEVCDPGYLMRDADADGEVEVETPVVGFGAFGGADGMQVDVV